MSTDLDDGEQVEYCVAGDLPEDGVGLAEVVCAVERDEELAVVVVVPRVGRSENAPPIELQALVVLCL